MTVTEAPPVPTIKLADGRNLAYAEYGDPAGRPVLFFHGTQSSRLERHPDESIARGRNARIITIDRPGHGLSDFQPGRTLLDWPADVAALADALGLGRFAVTGMSGGGPYALACARLIPDRLTGVGLISSSAPLDVPEVRQAMSSQMRLTFTLARRVPGLVSSMFSRNRKKALADPVKAIEPSIRQWSAPDQAIAARPEVRAMMPGIFAEAYRTGHEGAAWEISHILARPWGFDVAEVALPVTVWAGELDNNCPVAWGRWFAA